MEETNGYKIRVEKRVSTLEANYGNLEDKVDGVHDKLDNFIDNHFHHFKSEVFKKIDKNRGVPQWVVIMLSLFSSMVAGLAVFILTK